MKRDASFAKVWWNPPIYHKVNCFHEIWVLSHRLYLTEALYKRIQYIWWNSFADYIQQQIGTQEIASTNNETINFKASIVGRKEKGRRSCCQSRIGSFFKFFSRSSVVKACSSPLRGFKSICNFCFWWNSLNSLSYFIHYRVRGLLLGCHKGIDGGCWIEANYVAVDVILNFDNINGGSTGLFVVRFVLAGFAITNFFGLRFY